MVDHIEPLVGLTLAALAVIIWVTLVRLQRRRDRQIDQEVVAHWDALERADRLVIGDRACGEVWDVGTVDEGVDWLVCTRPYEHQGPCLDGLHGVLRR